MTIEEAIEQLKRSSKINEFSAKSMKETSKMSKETISLFAEVEKESLNENVANEIAIKALEKQIPKIITVNNSCHVKAFDSETETVCTFCCVTCPVCSKWIVANVNHKYCQCCGQALDWSDENG